MSNGSQADHVGRLIEGKYRLLRLLGRGGMGEVYEASHELIGRRVAIKLLHSEFLADDNTVRRFEQEARVATAIGHEHIIEITDMGRTDQDELFIVMEYLEGADLSGVLSLEPRFEVRRTCHIAIQILSALEAAHGKGIVHRDLKPANIFLVPRSGTVDYVKLVDFGISKVRDPRDNLASGFTRAGELLGTPLYMSPEQALGSTDVTYATDIFSLGVMMYEMLGGVLPFRASALPKLLHKIIREEPEPLAQLRPEVPVELCAIVERAMAKRPHERFDSASEMRRALRKFSPETSLVAGLKTTRISSRVALMQDVLRDRGSLAASGPPASARRGRWWFIVLGAVGAALFGAGLWWWLANPAAPVQPRGVAPTPSASANSVAVTHTEGTVHRPPVPATAQEVRRTGELTVVVEPSGAEISIDGMSLGQGSGKRFAIPLDRKTHSVVVQKAGYVEYTRNLVFESSLHLSITLKPEAGAAPTTPKPRSAAVESPSSATRQGSTGSVEPGKPTGTKRVIDEKSPW